MPQEQRIPWDRCPQPWHGAPWAPLGEGRPGGVPQGSSCAASSQNPGDPWPGRAGAAPVELLQQQGLTPEQESMPEMELGTSLGTPGKWEGSAPTPKAPPELGKLRHGAGTVPKARLRGDLLGKERRFWSRGDPGLPQQPEPVPGTGFGVLQQHPGLQRLSCPSHPLPPGSPGTPRGAPKPPRRAGGGAGTANPLPEPGLRCRFSPSTTPAREGSRARRGSNGMLKPPFRFLMSGSRQEC